MGVQSEMVAGFSRWGDGSVGWHTEVELAMQLTKGRLDLLAGFQGQGCKSKESPGLSLLAINCYQLTQSTMRRNGWEPGNWVVAVTIILQRMLLYCCPNGFWITPASLDISFKCPGRRVQMGQAQTTCKFLLTVLSIFKIENIFFFSLAALQGPTSHEDLYSGRFHTYVIFQLLKKCTALIQKKI